MVALQLSCLKQQDLVFPCGSHYLHLRSRICFYPTSPYSTNLYPTFFLLVRGSRTGYSLQQGSILLTSRLIYYLT